ncbi:MAG: GtrA family protein [Clostridia bacterium]|nr:GtrA family protein [Clostridia bacterium]
MCKTMSENPESFVLGCREFGEDTPSKSLIGNRITSFAMRLFYGISLTDTQTGLRGIPHFMTEGLLKVRGTRYEYELNMLIYAKGNCIPFVIIPIETIYFDNNSASHYRPIVDSARIFVKVISGLIGFSASAICAALIDISIYGIMTKAVLANFPLFWMLLIAFLTARITSSIINFALNRRLPLSQNKNILDTIPKYYTLVVIQMLVSFVGIYLLCAHTGIDEMIIKIIVDCILGLISYQIQLRWVFCNKPTSQKEKR